MARQARRIVARLAMATAATAALTGEAAAQGVEPVFSDDGQALPVYGAEAVIREDVWIETAVDSDADGALDRVHAEVARTESTALGRRMPVIVQPSPYYAGGNDIVNHDVDVELYEPGKPGRDNLGPDGELSARSGQAGDAGPAIGPGRYERYFLPRGFVFVYAESLGTGGSTGCPTIGGRSETLGMTAVVDWLTGRARAFDAAGEPVRATWSSGRVGMMGGSYNGTLPNAAASTGVAGLEAIVPIAAISSWYDYYRANGAVIAPGGFQGEDEDVLFDYVLTRQGREICAPVRDLIARDQDRVTGDYSPFWAERDYTLDVDRVRAAVLAVHGLNDANVKTQHVAQWYEPLARRGVPHRIWLHQRGHADPFTDAPPRREAWLATLNRWMTRWLYDVRNGAENPPRAVVERENRVLTDYADWPDPDAEPVRLWLSPAAGGDGGGLAPFAARPVGVPVRERIVDDARVTLSALLAAAEHPARLVYRTPPLAHELRMSGTTALDLRLAFDRPAANVSAALVDFRADGTAFVVNRGWIDPQNRKSRSATFAIHPGTPYEIAFGLQPDDYVFPAGSRPGIVLYSSDHQHSLRPAPGTTLTLDTTKSTVDLPVVGGAAALAAATGG